METDLVVIGGGLAGLVTAVESAERGLDVILLEKLESLGGTSSMSSGLLAFAGTDLQVAQGIKDSDDLFYEDMIEVGQRENDPDLVRTYVSEQKATYEWLKTHGVAFGPDVEISSGQSVPRVHTVDPVRAINVLADLCNSNHRITVSLGTPARSLIRSEMDGPVTAVVVESSKGSLTCHSRKGVVLTSGGFVHDPHLMHRLAPQCDSAIPMGSKGNVGDGLRMARRLGADFRDMAWIKGTYGKHPTDTTNNNACLAIYRGAIAVNTSGQRFVDESLSYKLIGDAALRQPQSVTYQIFDATIFATGDDRVRIFDFAQRLRAGLLMKSESLEELAARVGIDVGALSRTVTEYNRSIENGVDDLFGRRHLVHKHGKRRPIVNPPFYAYPSAVAILGTYCGLCVDAQTRVLDVEGNVIDGLFAAGEVVGGFHGAAYMTGTSLGKAAVFGRIAARQAAQSGQIAGAFRQTKES